MNQPTINQPIKYRPDIDALRAIAVIFVIIFHLDEKFLSSGFIGVDVFFVISGYLITRIIFKNCKNKNFSFINFYARRTKRIFPALFVVLFFSGVFAVISLPQDIYENFFKSFKYASAQLSNFFFARKVGYFDDTGHAQPLLHTWSLGVEEQFYVIWPLIIFALVQIKSLSRKSSFWIFIVLAIVSWIGNSYLQTTNSQKAFYMFYTRAWEFCFGAIIALEVIPQLKNKILNFSASFIGLIMIFVAAFYESSSSNYMLIVTTVSSLGAAIVIYSGQKNSTLIHKLLSFKAIVFIGLISYSLYLWHWPVIIFFKQFFGEGLNTYSYLIIAITSVLLSVLSYYLVEQKTRYIDSISDKKTLVIGLGAIIIFAVGGILMLKFSDSSWRIDRPNVEKSAKVLELDKQFFKLPKNLNRKLESPDILLIGDSHAVHYFPIIHKKAQAKNLKVGLVDEDGCSPILGDYKIVNLRANRTSRTVEERCKVLQDRIKEKFKNKSIKQVFIAMRQAVYTETKVQKGFGENSTYFTKDPEGELTLKENREIFSKSLESTIKYIQSLGVKVNLLGQVPMLLTNPNRCSEITLIDKMLHSEAYIERRQKECYAIDFEYVNKRLKYSTDEYEKLSKKYDLEYFSPIDSFSSVIDENGVILYRDDHHLNYSGMRFLLNEVKFDIFDE